MRGLVIKSTGSLYLILTDKGKRVECKVKGSFRLKGIKATNPVAVGDYVTISSDDQNTTAYITEIEERRNYIIRRSSNLSKMYHIIASNLDQCVLMVTINHPITSTIFIDRFLASAQAYRIPAIILVNKADLYSETENRKAEELISLYRSIGHECFLCDSLRGTGIENIKERLSGKVSLLSGNSGVGKSTLINKLSPGLKLRTGNLSEKHNKGTHTTTFSEMLELPSGGWIIDSPGIKGFGVFDMETEEIGHYFPEIFYHSKECRFSDCTHTTEPDCAVIKALQEGKIKESRYLGYLSILRDEDENKYRETE